MDSVVISFVSVSGLRPLASHVEFGFAPRTRASWRKRSFASAAWWPTTPVVAAVFIADVNTGSLSSDASHWKAASISLALPDPKASTIALSKEEGSKRGIVFTQAAVLEVHEPAAVGSRQPNAAAATFGLLRCTLRAMMRAQSQKPNWRSPREPARFQTTDNYEYTYIRSCGRVSDRFVRVLGAEVPSILPSHLTLVGGARYCLAASARLKRCPSLRAVEQ